MSKHRWKDSLDPITVGDPETHMRKAIKWLGHAIDDVDNNYRRQHLAYAGAHIRAARKGLGDTWARVGDHATLDPELLTMAVRYVTRALDGQRYLDEGQAYWLRCAEACLRTMWKRAQS